MIVSVCADKGAPGVTTLTAALGVVWSGERMVLEADISGADLPFRLLHQAGTGLLNPQPSVLDLATDLRRVAPYDVVHYGQPTALGVSVVPGGRSAEAFAGMAPLWPQIAQTAYDWSGTVLADLGRMQPADPATPVAALSTAVLVLARPDMEGLYHLRERVLELTATLGRPYLEQTPVAVVLRARSGQDSKLAVKRARAVLDAEGSPVPVLGVFAEDPAGAEALRGRQVTRKLLGTDLLQSTRTLAEALLARWPQLTGAAAPAVPAVTTAAPAEPTGVSPRWGRLAGLRQQPESGQVSA